LARIQALEIDNAQLRNKLIETNEECFNLQATMVANEVEVKHMASVELEKVQSELSFKVFLVIYVILSRFYPQS